MLAGVRSKITVASASDRDDAGRLHGGVKIKIIVIALLDDGQQGCLQQCAALLVLLFLCMFSSS
jgi:hypothetical protein